MVAVPAAIPSSGSALLTGDANAMSSSAFPRVLVVNHASFNWSHCNGITLSNLFAGWPQDRLAALVLSPGEIADDVCNRHWRLTRADILRALAGRPPQDGPVAPCRADAVPPAAAPAPRTPAERQWRVPLGELVFRLPSVLSEDLQRWVRAFAPDVCFSMLGTGTAACVTTRLARLVGAPIVPFFTDDWLSTLYGDLWARHWLRRSLRYWMGACLERAPLRFAASDEMAAEYRQRFGGRFEVVSNSISAADYPDQVPSPVTNPVLRFVYAGGLYLDRWQAIIEIGQALAALRAEGLNAELLVYTSPDNAQSYREALDFPPVRLMGWLPPEDLPRVLMASDINIHVESFTPSHSVYTRLSFSTKIPQLLMAGRCILAYGPAGLASIRHLTRAGAGIVVERQDPQALREALRRLLTDSVLREDAGRAGRRVAMGRYEAASERERVRRLLNEACRLGVPQKNP